MKLPIIRLLWLLSATAASAATHAVLPGEAIQPKIDAAAPGDIIAIFGGTYPGDVTINKAVRLVEVDGQEVTITGNVTWNGVTDAPPFEGFTVGSAGKGITVNNTTGLVIKNVDARAGFGLRTNGTSKINVVTGQYSAIAQDGGELTTALTTVTGNFSTTLNSLKTVAFRTYVGLIAAWNSQKCWLGYSDVAQFTFAGTGCRVVIIGTSITPRPLQWPVNKIQLNGSNNSYHIMNSLMTSVGYADKPGDSFWGGGPSRGIYLSDSGNEAVFINNYIEMVFSGTYAPAAASSAGEGISTATAKCKIMNNIIVGAHVGITAPFGATVENNCVHGSRYTAIRGGVVAVNTFDTNPLFAPSGAPDLQPSSPCINAGTIDPVFNDLDGSRNDVGPRGGCFFDPEGWTTNKPVVISFDLAPQQLLKGVDTQVTISNGQAVAQP